MSEAEVKLQGFKLYPSVYFVGNERVSVHIIDTSNGLVMIDTGYPDMLDVILKNIENIGLCVKNICAIFHSHGHIDHFGCTREIAALSGAKTYISRIDNDILNGKLDLSWARELGCEPIPPFSCDVLIEDGDIFDFGDTGIRCVHTPGHTDGVMSFFITLPDGKIAAMHGGGGINTQKSEFLNRYGLSFDCRRKFRESLDKVRDERVDVILGNHPEQTGTLEKMVKVLSGETDVFERGEWDVLLGKLERAINKICETDPE